VLVGRPATDSMGGVGRALLLSLLCGTASVEEDSYTHTQSTRIVETESGRKNQNLATTSDYCIPSNNIERSAETISGQDWAAYAGQCICTR